MCKGPEAGPQDSCPNIQLSRELMAVATTNGVTMEKERRDGFKRPFKGKTGKS